MERNLVLGGMVFRGVEYITMTSESGEPLTFVEKTNTGNGVPVAEIGEQKFYTVEDALSAATSGETVTLIADSAEDVSLIIPTGVTLDLQGYTLTADRLIGLNGSYLNAKRPSSTTNTLGGILNVPEDNLILSENGYKLTEVAYVLPVWNPEAKHFQFSQFIVNTNNDDRGLWINEEKEKIYFQFKHQASTLINQRLLADGASDNELAVKVVLEWSNDSGAAGVEFVYNDEQVGYIVLGKYSETEGKNIAMDYTFTLTNYSQLNIDISTLKVYAKIETNSGATAFGDVWTLENAKQL